MDNPVNTKCNASHLFVQSQFCSSSPHRGCGIGVAPHGLLKIPLLSLCRYKSWTWAEHVRVNCLQQNSSLDLFSCLSNLCVYTQCGVSLDEPHKLQSWVKPTILTIVRLPFPYVYIYISYPPTFSLPVTYLPRPMYISTPCFLVCGQSYWRATPKSEAHDSTKGKKEIRELCYGRSVGLGQNMVIL